MQGPETKIARPSKNKLSNAFPSFFYSYVTQIQLRRSEFSPIGNRATTHPFIPSCISSQILRACVCVFVKPKKRRDACFFVFDCSWPGPGVFGDECSSTWVHFGSFTGHRAHPVNISLLIKVLICLIAASFRFPRYAYSASGHLTRLTINTMTRLLSKLVLASYVFKRKKREV